jgi:hypothetical protein
MTGSFVEMRARQRAWKGRPLPPVPTRRPRLSDGYTTILVEVQDRLDAYEAALDRYTAEHGSVPREVSIGLLALYEAVERMIANVTGRTDDERGK